MKPRSRRERAQRQRQTQRWRIRNRTRQRQRSRKRKSERRRKRKKTERNEGQRKRERNNERTEKRKMAKLKQQIRKNIMTEIDMTRENRLETDEDRQMTMQHSINQWRTTPWNNNNRSHHTTVDGQPWEFVESRPAPMGADNSQSTSAAAGETL